MKTRTKILVGIILLVAVSIVVEEVTRTKYAQFRIESVPSGATVYVMVGSGGFSSSDYITPCFVDVEVGIPSVISVEKAGYHTMEKSVYASREGYAGTKTFMLQADNPVDNLVRRIFG